MSKKKNQEMRNLAIEDLQNELSEAQVNYNKMLYDHSVQPMDNPLVIREMRRDIARLKTEVRRRELNDFSPEQLAKREKIRDRRRNN